MGRLRHAMTYNKDERGIAYGVRTLGRRSARSSRRSNDLPRRAGKPLAGRRDTGDWMRMRPGGMRNAECRHGVRHPS